MITNTTLESAQSMSDDRSWARLSLGDVRARPPSVDVRAALAELVKAVLFQDEPRAIPKFEELFGGLIHYSIYRTCNGWADWEYTIGRLYLHGTLNELVDDLYFLARNYLITGDRDDRQRDDQQKAVKVVPPLQKWLTRSRAPLQAFITRTVNNYIRDLRDKAFRQPRVIGDLDVLLDSGVGATDPFDEYEHMILKRQWLMKLSPRDREIVYQVKVVGILQKEVAASFHITPGWVSQILAAADRLWIDLERDTTSNQTSGNGQDQ